ncbi:MAG TPA: bacillithiol system redox-active protein YtxJ [Flavipsychrobacter sp.]|nr:bacillithiol system redox-active protein YtxJ [Flavipsychrobacter sp.]
MEWKNLEAEAQLDAIMEESRKHPVVIFKHSTRCSISSMAKGRLDKHAAPEGTSFYYLDLIANRNLSNRIAEIFNVHHESPQVLLIRNGECVYEESHNGIYFEEILDQIQAA